MLKSGSLITSLLPRLLAWAEAGDKELIPRGKRLQAGRTARRRLGKERSKHGCQREVGVGAGDSDFCVGRLSMGPKGGCRTGEPEMRSACT